VRRELDQCPETARRQARSRLRRLPARPVERLPQAFADTLTDVAARWRREPAAVGRFRRTEHDGRQLDQGQALAIERRLAAQQDPEFGIHDHLETVGEGGPQRGAMPDTGPRGGHDCYRVAAAGRHRSPHLQAESAE
jgi:hypothetical protein